MTVDTLSPDSTAPAQAASSVAAPVAADGAAPLQATPVVQETPVVVAQAEPLPAPEPKAEPVKATTVLGALKNDEPKPADSDAVKADATTGEAKEGTQSDEPAPLPPYEDFAVPEGMGENFKFDEAQIGEFKNELMEFEKTTKAPREEVQKLAQSLLNRHAKAQQEVASRVADIYHQAWEKNKADWKEAFEKDPEIGGNRVDTTTAAALQFIRTHGGTEAQQQEFQALMESTGLGNHPAMIRILANAGTAFSEGRPLPAAKPVGQPQSKIAKRYGGSA